MRGWPSISLRTSPPGSSQKIIRPSESQATNILRSAKASAAEPAMTDCIPATTGASGLPPDPKAVPLPHHPSILHRSRKRRAIDISQDRGCGNTTDNKPHQEFTPPSLRPLPCNSIDLGNRKLPFPPDMARVKLTFHEKERSHFATCSL